MCFVWSKNIYFHKKIENFLYRKFMNVHENNESSIVCGWLFQKPAVLALDFRRKRVTFHNFLLKIDYQK